MLGYLRRLATTGFAYTASSVLSKLVAIALLPLYTSYLDPSDYGAAEVMITGVIAASIVVRLGVIEALMRFYYIGGERPNEVVRTGFASLFWATTVAVALMFPFAGAISEALLGEPDAELARIAIGGLWIFTLYEYLVSLFRLDERARAYFFFTFANVLVAIPLTVFLVVVEDQGASGLLLGTYGAAVPFVAWVAIEQRRRLSLVPKLPLLRRMLRFGFPTMPAELSLYSLSFIDRIVIARLAGLAEAGLYALAVKFSQAVNVLVRGFQLAWPPLAYSVVDDDEARRAYALVVTWFTALCTFVVVGMWLFSRWIVRIFTTPEFFGSYEAIGLVSTGVTLYALYLVLVVILGRTGRTEFNFPATLVATAANIGLNLLLVPPLGIKGAGLALVASYIIVLVLMYGFTQRLFAVPYEWRRLAMVVGSAVVLVAGGELLLPTEGFAGLAGRTAVWFAFPLLLWFGGFLEQGEREALGRLLDPATLRERLSAVGASATTPGEPSQQEEGRGPRLTAEVYEAERRDEDSRL